MVSTRPRGLAVGRVECVSNVHLCHVSRCPAGRGQPATHGTWSSQSVKQPSPRCPRNDPRTALITLTHDGLGDLAMEDGDRDSARYHFEAALQVARRVHERDNRAEYAARLSIALVKVGDIDKLEERFDGMWTHYVEALAIDEGMVADHPGIYEYEDNLSWSYERLGVASSAYLGDREQAFVGDPVAWRRGWDARRCVRPLRSPDRRGCPRCR